jgi:hypothetical protein
MKRTGEFATIASLFRNHAAKRKASPSSPPPVVNVEEEQIQEVVEEIEESMQEGVFEEIVNHVPSSPPPPIYDINWLPQDPGERPPISDYPVNDQDAVRRAYILKGPFQDLSHDFKVRVIGKRSRQFNPFWFHKHH